MADEVDEANDRVLRRVEEGEARARGAAAAMPTGVAGECSQCGEWSGRLVLGACARCRDLRGLP